MKPDTAVQERMLKALKMAFHYGQVYWEQSDSEFYSANKKAVETHAKFLKLCDETLQTLADVGVRKNDLALPTARWPNTLDA